MVVFGLARTQLATALVPSPALDQVHVAVLDARQTARLAAAVQWQQRLETDAWGRPGAETSTTGRIVAEAATRASK